MKNPFDRLDGFRLPQRENQMPRAQIALLAAGLLFFGFLRPARTQTVPTSAFAPAFTLKDAQGRIRSLSEWHGRAGVVYFFCGCPWCHECAQAWGALQRSGALPTPNGRPAQTLVVYTGDIRATRVFAAGSGLDAKQTVFLADPDARVTRAYHSLVCPRVFVLDEDGVTRYTNNHADDAPRKASANVIVANVVSALRAPASEAAPRNPTPNPVPIPAAPAAPASASSGVAERPLLTALPDNAEKTGGKGMTASSPARYNFGNADILDGRAIEHTFRLRNDGKKPLVLERLAASCGCTTLFLDEAALAVPPGAKAARIARTVLPGQTIPLRVRVDPSRLSTGEARKLVWVFARGSSLPALTLEMVGAIRSPITLDPPVLDFGRANAGAPSTLILTATLDARLLRVREPLIVCDNPNVRITPLNAPKTAAASEAGNVASPRSAPGKIAMTTRTYRVELAPDIPLGVLNNRLSFVFVLPQSQAAQSMSASALPPTRAMPLGPLIPVIGEVVGKLASQPKTLVFGLARPGQTLTRRLMLTGSADDLRAVTVSGSAALLTVRLLPFSSEAGDGAAPANAAGAAAGAAPRPVPASRTVEITLQAPPRPGALQMELTARLPDGTRLVVPVVASVLAAR